MAEFESWRGYFSFAHFVKCKARHILDAKSQHFLKAVLETSEKRRTPIEKGVVLYRSQLAHRWRTQPLTDENGVEVDSVDVAIPADRERMIPRSDRATEGRVNAKGIPCLYLSTDPNTAMAEVRPWIGSYVSVASFEVLRDLTVVDCSAESKRGWMFFEGEPAPDKREQRVWGDINRAFAEPVARADDLADYAATQVLAEAFRFGGFDGIVYGSKLGEGKSVAIFDLDAAKPINCYLYQVNSINPLFSPRNESWQ
jgi:hypothetical protein